MRRSLCAVLGVTEVDVDFNANVVTHSDGAMLHGIGGWQDALFSRCAILAVPTFRDRVPIIGYFIRLNMFVEVTFDQVVVWDAAQVVTLVDMVGIAVATRRTECGRSSNRSPGMCRFAPAAPTATMPSLRIARMRQLARATARRDSAS